MGLYFDIFFGCIIDASKISIVELDRICNDVYSDYSRMSHKDGKYYVRVKSIKWISVSMKVDYVIECRVAFIKQVREAVIAWLLCAPQLLRQKDLHKRIGLMIMATKFDRIWKPRHPRRSKSSEPSDQ